jgi:hypothetical protein
MSTEHYEIELVRSETEHDYHVSMLATITGISKEEIYERLPATLTRAKSWRGRNFIEAARGLGFNVNPRFIKFDPATPWPCILRVQVPDAWDWKGCWWALVYNQGYVYNGAGGEDDWHCCSLKNFLAANPGCRITSMLQIWMPSL